ncbi:hypothetical protein Tco_0308726 [Tanacetum coccineum]
MSSASSAVTYTSVYTDSEPGRVFWGADEEIPDGGVPRVIVYGYDGLPMQPVDPPSPDYVPGPEHPPSPIEIPYVPEPEYPEYLVPSKDEAPMEDQPLPDDASPAALSPGYVPDSDPEEHPEEDDEEEEEHLAPADSSIIPIVDPVPSAGDTEAFETDESAPTPRPPQIRIPFAQTRLRRARKTVRPEPPMSASMEARIAEVMKLMSNFIKIWLAYSVHQVYKYSRHGSKRYGARAIGASPGTRSIQNSTFLGGGNPGNSSGNTSGKS